MSLFKRFSKQNELPDAQVPSQPSPKVKRQAGSSRPQNEVPGTAAINNRPTSSPVSRPRSNTDPETCLEVFKSHWSHVKSIVNGQHSPAKPNNVKQQLEDAEAVMRYLDQMNLLLVEESSNDGSQGPILEFLLMEDVLNQVLSWSFACHASSPDLFQRMKLYYLKTYELLISQAKQPLLLHKPIIRPLFILLASCSQDNQVKLSIAIETRLILILHQLCVCVTQNKQILELLFDATADHGSSGFLMFSLLIPYTHREGAIGQQARDALLLIMALSYSHEDIGIYIADNSHFCPVLATGLSGLYSSLPRKLNYPSDDWYRLTQSDINEMPDLVMFLNSLEFCNAVVQVAHPVVREKLLNFIYNGFLVPVLGPALHQNDIKFTDYPDVLLDDDFDDGEGTMSPEEKFLDLLKLPFAVLDSYFGTSVEEVIAATAYTELFLGRVTEPALMRTFLKFILTEKFDDMNILESLVQRINSNSRLCMVTLSLFQSLVDLNCEDVMFQLVFKYLIPCTHVMVSQRRAVRDVDLYGRASEKFLSLTPSCCLTANHSHHDETCSPDSPRSIRSGLNISIPTNSVPVPSAELQTALVSAQQPPPEPKRRFQFSFRRKSKAEPPQPTMTSSSTAPESPTPFVHDGGTHLAQEPGTNSLDNGQFSPDNASISSADFNSLRNASPDSFSVSSISSSPLVPNHFDRLRYESHYIEYLAAARHQIQQCCLACCCWQAPYNGEQPPPDSFTSSSVTNPSDPESSAPISDSKIPEAPPHQSPKESKSENSDSAVSDGDSAFSAGSPSVMESSTNNSRSDSPLNDDFSNQDFAAFLLQLKRVKTPVEFCDSLEQSLSEMDELISRVQTVTSPSSENLPSFGDAKPKSGVISPEASTKPSAMKRSASNQGFVADFQSKRESAEGIPGESKEGESMPRLIAITTAPDIGPFLTALLHKLECLMHNSLYVNLLLTGLIWRLACYPQPLLRSFLLNHSLVFQPSVKSLVQVLSSVKHKIDGYAFTVKDFGQLLTKARRFLAWREDVYLHGNNPSRQRSDSTLSLPAIVKKPPDPKDKKRVSAIGDFLFGRKNNRVPSPATPASRLQLLGDGKGFRYFNLRNQGNPDPTDPMEALKTKNAVYCALVFEEFLKELAAVAQEHAVAADEISC